MRHFVAYHKTDDRGPIDRTKKSRVESIGSKKSLSFLQRAIGSRVWLFEGRGTANGNSVFYLVYTFIAEAAVDAANGEEKQLRGSSVVYFAEDPLNDYSWFKVLKTTVANFSHGFQEVSNPEVIAQLETYLTEEDAINFGERLPAVFTEGKGRMGEISIRERSILAREACIRHHGAICFICGFDFALTYGERAQGFIEVHHRKQLSEAIGSRSVDAISDLIPLCANCHRVVHLFNPPIEVEILKEEIKKKANRAT